MIDNSLTIKFVYIKFIGDKTRPMFRARLTTQSEAIQRKFDPHHVALTESSLDDISQEIFERHVANASMSKSREVVSQGGTPRHPNHTTSIRITSSTTTPTVTTTAAAATATPVNANSSTATGRSTSTSSGSVSAAPKFGAKLEIQSAVDAAIRDVRSDESETDWCLAGYVDDEKHVVGLIGSGSGGLEELKQHLRNDNVHYGLLRVTDKVDESVTIKFVGIVHVGDGLRPTHKARIVTQRGSVESHFRPYHVDITVSTADELQFTEIMRLVQETSGSGSRVVDSATGRAQSHLTAVTAASDNRGNVNLAARSARRASTHLLSFHDLDKVRDEIADLRDDTTATNWIALGYVEGSRDRIGFISKGDGGVLEMKQLFEDDKVFYCLARVQEVIDESLTTKFAFVHWLGENVSPMLKARVSTHKGPVTELLGQVCDDSNAADGS